MYNDKNKLLEKWSELDGPTIEFGCGSTKRIPNSIGIDQLDFECVDIVGDALEILKKIESNSVKRIYSFHFIEHVSNLEALVKEFSRVLISGGTIETIVPHFSNPYFYSDYTHKAFFGLYTFSYFAESSIFRRRVPKYGVNLPLVLEEVKLIFRSERPFYLRHAIGYFLTKIINFTNFTKEIYEGNFCHIYSCYEVKYIVRKN